MSHLLWKYYLEDNVDKFRHLLASGSNTAQYTPKGHGGGAGQYGSLGTTVGSPGASVGTSPRTTIKTRKSSGFAGNTSGSKGHSLALTRGDINGRDQSGLTILHRCVSSTTDNAKSFALALIDHPGADLYLQDFESGWTALHRALYFGNVTIARALLERDLKDSRHGSSTAIRGNALIKIKDHEGNSAFDVYNATIARRILDHHKPVESVLVDEEDDEEPVNSDVNTGVPVSNSIDGDEVFAFGSNKNFSLGFGDEDDRQHPEKITLKRPDHLLRRFFKEYLELRRNSTDGSGSDKSSNANLISELPTLIKHRPIVIQDMNLSKYHSAILTTDPEANLYMCGFGPGGRLGTGDEITRFNYSCIEGGALEGRKVGVSIKWNQSQRILII